MKLISSCDLQLKRKEMFWGTYKDVRFEINKTVNNMEYNNSQYSWTYYIFIFLDDIPKELYKLFWTKDTKDSYGKNYYHANYTKADIYFHCGITWYSKEYNYGVRKKYIKVGCDFSHYWDEGHEYDIDDIVLEVKKTINDYCELVKRGEK